MAEPYPTSSTPPELATGTQDSPGATAQPPSSHTAVHIDDTSPITTLYLTFQTPLPTPSTTIISPSSLSPSSPPPAPAPAPPPNLTPYTDPHTWPPRTKYLMLLLSCTATFLTAYTAGSYSPPQHLIRQDLLSTTSTSNIPILTGITSFCLGFGLAPMFLAPFSEMNGRYPVFVVSGVVYVVFQAVCGVVTNLAGMVVARALVGVGASVFSTMVGGVIADMWGMEERNTPMALFSGSVIAGTGAGPLVGAVMAWRWDDGVFPQAGEEGEAGRGNHGVGAKWKWIFWHQVIMGAVLMGFLVVSFRESRGSVLLSRKARRVNEWYGRLEEQGFFGVWMAVDDEGGMMGSGEVVGEEGSNKVLEGGLTDEEKGSNVDNSSRVLKRIRWIVKEDEERSSLGKMIAISVTRPFGMLFTEPVVFFFSLYVSFAWGILYLTFGCIPLVFRRQYGWNLEEAGYIFTALIVGAFLSTILSILQERLLYHPQWRASVDSASDEESEVESPPSSTSNNRGNEKAISSNPSSSSDIEQQRPPLPGTNLPSDSEEKKTPSSSSSSSSISPSPPLPSSPSPFWTFMRHHFPASAPESRLYFTCLTSTLLPLGMFIFGFTARPSVHWIVPAIGISLAAMGILSVYLAVFNYLADTYHRYASSALAAQSLCRNVLGGVFPLVTAVMLERMGEARAIGMLGAIATGLSAVPWVLVFFGERIRRRSPFASQLKAG